MQLGDEVFACDIASDADDYRYAGQTGHNLIIKPYDLPEDISKKCIKLSKSLKLGVAGIDLRHDPNNGDKWFCFEVNPSPGFTYFQNHTNQPIAASIAKLLSSFEN
jgi:glutathione synthase/RimK-type ligase-like ATP-grasp enzyme